MSKKLKLWNGRCYGPLPPSQWKRNGEQANIYVAAYSREDARRVCTEAGLLDPGVIEIRDYWSEGGWGNPMNGITPERGIWVLYGYHGLPERLSPIDQAIARAGGG